MSEELKNRSRLAAALIAGPAVTVGLMGVGAPAFADEEVEEPDSSTEETENTEDSTDDAGEGADSDEDSDAEGSDSDEDSDDEDSDDDGETPDSDDPANEGDNDTEGEDVGPQNEGEDELPVTTAPESAAPGETIQLSGENFEPGAEITINIGLDNTVATTTADEDGSFTAEVTIPEDALVGAPVAIEAFGEDSDYTTNVNIVEPEGDEDGDSGDDDDNADDSDDSEDGDAGDGDTDDGGEDDSEDDDEESEDGDDDSDDEDAPGDDEDEDEGDEQESGWTIDHSVVWWGGTLSGTITAFPENIDIDLILSPTGEDEETVVGSVTTDENGDAEFSIDIDSDWEAGNYSLGLDLGDEGSTTSIWFDIREAPPENEDEFWWYGAPESHQEEGGYADWIQALINQAIDPDDDQAVWEYSPDAQVYAEPDLDSEVFGPLSDPDESFTPGYGTNSTLLGYLVDEDWYIIYDAYAQTLGFVAGDSVLEDDPDGLHVETGTDVEAGDTIEVTGAGFEPGEEVTLTIDGEEVGTETANDHGEVSFEVTIPEDAEHGVDLELTAVGEDSEFEASVTLAVVDPDADDGDDDDEDDDSDDEDDDGDEDDSDDDEDDYDSDDDDLNTTLSADKDELYPGDEITVVGEDFSAEEDVVFTLNPELDTVPADADGVVTAVLTIPEDTEPGEHEISAVGAESDHEATVTITVLDPEDGDDDEADVVDPALTTDVSEIALEDFVGSADDGEGVAHLVVGLEPGAEIEALTSGPENVEDNLLTRIADDNGEVGFNIAGFDIADPSVYLGEYTTVVTFEDEDGEIHELSTSFTVVDGTSDDSGSGDDDGDAGDGSGSDDGAGGDKGSDPAGSSDDSGDGSGSGSDDLAQTGATAGQVGLISGLLLLIGGGLAALGFKNRLGRRDTEA